MNVIHLIQLRRGPPGQDGVLYEANTIHIGEGDPHGAEPNLGHLVLRRRPP